MRVRHRPDIICGNSNDGEGIINKKCPGMLVAFFVIPI